MYGIRILICLIVDKGEAVFYSEKCIDHSLREYTCALLCIGIEISRIQ